MVELGPQLMRRAARKDSNQSDVVRGLRAAGATVRVIGQPLDLLVGYKGRNYLLEVKNRDGRNRLTPDQVTFLREWTGHAAVVRDLGDALKEIGAPSR
jgi:hypothetical protein